LECNLSFSDIENKLSEYNRHDKLPPWASSFLSRLENIEQNHIYLHRALATEKKDFTSDDNEQKPQMSDLNNDNRILSKLRYELDTTIQSQKLQMESSVTQLQLEIERLHKLLEIRPTTAEMQKIVQSIGDTNRKMQFFLNDVTNTVRFS
jgi:hypothetical protein